MQYQIDKLFQKLRCVPDIRKTIDVLRQIYLIDPKARPDIEQIIRSLFDNYRERIILEPLPRVQARGDLYIGDVFCERALYPFHLRKNELVKHMAIYGVTGSGKTTLIDRIASERLRTGEPILIFDWDGSHRHLLNKPEGKNLRYYSIGSPISPFYFNPHRVPDSFSFDERVTLFTAFYNSLIERHLPPGSVTKRSLKLHLRKLLIEEFLSEGLLDFTFADLREVASTGRLYISVEDFLSQFVYGPLGKVFNSAKHSPVRELFTQQSLLDLSFLVNPEERADFTDLLLSYAYEVFFKRGKLPHANNILKVLLVIEEVQNLFTQQGKNIISDFFREFRKWGGGLIISDQNPSALPRFIRGNTFYTVVLHLGSKEDIEAMASAMTLNGDERHYLTRIPSGEGLGIMKMQSRFTSPFVVKIAPLQPAREKILYHDDQRQIRPSQKESAQIQEISTREEGKKEEKRLPPNEQALLANIVKNPNLLVTERYRMLGLNRYQGNKAQKSLTAKGLIRQARIPDGVLLEPTGAEQKANAEHEYYKEKVHQFFKQNGHQVTKEKPVPHGKVDVVANFNGKRIAVEIETGKSDAIKNIRKCLDAGFDMVYIVPTRTAVRNKIATLLSQAGLDKHPRVMLLDASTFA